MKTFVKKKYLLKKISKIKNIPKKYIYMPITRLRETKIKIINE